MVDTNQLSLQEQIARNRAKYMQPTQETAPNGPTPYEVGKEAAAMRDQAAQQAADAARAAESRPDAEKWMGMGTALATGAEKGAFGLLGMPADLINLAKTYGPAVLSGLGTLTVAGPSAAALSFKHQLEESMKGLTPEERAGTASNVFGINLPTGKAVVEGLAPYVPGLGYKPQGGAEQFLSNVGEFAGGSLLPGVGAGTRALAQTGKIVPALTEAALATARDIIPSTVAGTTSEALGTLTQGTSLEPWARMGGALLGYPGGSALESMTPWAKKIASENIAAQTLKSAARGNEKALAEEIARGTKGAPYLPGAKPTATDLAAQARQAGIQNEMEALQSRAMGKEAFRETKAGEAAAQDAQARVAAIKQGGEELLGDLSDAYNKYAEFSADPVAAQKDAFDKFSDAFNTANDNAANLWKSPALDSASYDANAIENAVAPVLSNLGAGSADFKRLMGSRLQELSSYLANGEVPLRWLHDLRKDIGFYRFNRDVAPSVSDDLTKLYNAITDTITDPNALTMGSKQNLMAQNAAQDFMNASAATKQLKDTFGDTSLSRFFDGNGKIKVSEDSFLDNVLKGDIGKNLDALQNAGVDVSNELADYILRKYRNENNGLFRMSEKDAQKLKTDYGAVFNRIPKLEPAIDSILDLTKREQVFSGIQDAIRGAVDPASLAKQIDQNADYIKSFMVLPNGAPDLAKQKFVDALKNSAQLYDNLPQKLTGKSAEEYIKRLQNGNMFDLIYGAGSGRVLDALSGVGVGVAATNIPFLNMLGSTLLFGGGQLVSAAMKPSKWIGKAISEDIANRSREFLVKAFNDPQMMQYLLLKPTPANIGLLQQHVLANYAGILGTGARMTGASSQDLNPPENKMTGEDWYKAAEKKLRDGTPTRATGGRVNRIDAMASKLVGMAERAKKSLSNKTQPLLNVPDETITKALEVAQQHL